MPKDIPVFLAAQRKRDVQLDGRIPPFGIMCVGEALRRAGYKVRLFHLCGEQGEKLLERAVLDERPLFVGFSNCVSPTIKHDIRLSKRLHDQGIKVVWGGVFPSSLPETTLGSGYVDYVVVGEGERPAVALAEAIENNATPAGVPGLGYVDGGEVVIEPPSPVEPDLDNYPININAVYIQDDNSFGKTKKGMEQIESLGLEWISTAHLQYVTPEFLSWAKDSGCLNLSFGVESGSERILKRMNKRIDRESIRERMRLIGETGLASWAFFHGLCPGRDL